MVEKAVAENTLFYDDNLHVLREYIGDESVDLIYLDPPFNSHRSYHILFRDESVRGVEAQTGEAEDSWHWDKQAESTYFELIQKAPIPVSKMINALRECNGANQMTAFLVMMTARLIELHRVLKPTGSLYLHCDPASSHYLKIILDTIFGARYFRNEIIWPRVNGQRESKTWTTVTDTILFYTKSDHFTWNPVALPASEQPLEVKYRNVDRDGRRFTLVEMTSPNLRNDTMYEWKGYPSPPNGWRYSKETMNRMESEGRIWYPQDRSKRPRLKKYLDEMPGRPEENIWTDISPKGAQTLEKFRYPAQKPLALLDRIIEASSSPGDMVLDPFCGCGTAVIAAHRLNRRWIGIDVTHPAISLMKSRLKENFGLVEQEDYRVIGEPQTLAAAQLLARQNPSQFQWWALSLVQARPVGNTGARPGKKAAGKAHNGMLSFVDTKNRQQNILVQVKNDPVSPEDIRDLLAVLDRDRIAMGLLISLERPGWGAIAQASSAGVYRSTFGGQNYPRIQILTIEELLGGRLIDMPPAVTGNSKQAHRSQSQGAPRPGIS